MEITFKNAELTDLKIVREIALVTWPQTFGYMLPADQIKYMLEQIYNDDALRQQLEHGHHFILAEQDGDTVGFCSYEINYKSSGHFMIHKLYILPSMQGLGIGTKFLDRLAEIARLNHATVLRLKVFHLNFKAIDFYEQYGFSKAGTETRPIQNYDAIIDYIMIKALSCF